MYDAAAIPPNTRTKGVFASMIHPTAIIDSSARIDPTVSIGPYCVITGPVQLGPDCVLDSHVHLIGPMNLGARNHVHSFAVLGDTPQDRKHKDDPSRLIIGNDNIFREHVTVHRGTNGDTVIGSGCFFMAGSHVAHNCRVADNVTLINQAVLGGHVLVEEKAIIGGNCAVHQFCRIGKLTMISNNSAHNTDIPPYVISMNINTFTQLNLVGLRRSGMSPDTINAIRRMFKVIFRERSSLPLARAFDQLPADLAAIPEIQYFINFCRESKRGVAKYHAWSLRHSSGAAEH